MLDRKVNIYKCKSGGWLNVQTILCPLECLVPRGVTLLVAFGFLQTFWEVAGAYEISFHSKMNAV